MTYGSDRAEAIERMIRAIDEYHISGVETTLGFCKFVMQHEAFVSGDFNTQFVQKHFKPEALHQHDEKEEEIAVLIVAKLVTERKPPVFKQQSSTHSTSKWKANRLTDD